VNKIIYKPTEHFIRVKSGIALSKYTCFDSTCVALTDQVIGPFVLEEWSLEYIEVITKGNLNSKFEINVDPTHSLNLQVYQTGSLSQRNVMIGNGNFIRHASPHYQYKCHFCVVFELITRNTPDSIVLLKKGQVKVDSKL
jgi:hypothetical protein